MACSAYGADITVTAQANTSEGIYVGQRFAYGIVINGSDKPGKVDTSQLNSFNPQYAGGQNKSHSFSSNINGRITNKVIKKYLMIYYLTASRNGKMTIPSVNVTVEGKAYRTNPVDVEILEPDTTAQMEMEMTLSKERCYVGEPIVLDVKWLILKKIDRARANDDFNFNIPVFLSDAFIIDDTGQKSPQAGLLNINGIDVYTEQKDVARKGLDWVQISFSKVLIPKSPGTVKIDKVSVLSKFAVKEIRRTIFGPEYEYKRFITEAKSLDLEVLPLPQQAKPKGFYGLIGEYKITTSATPTRVNVGEPITLTIAVQGDYLKPVQWPDLEGNPQFASNFKIPAERSSPTVRNGSKIFTQTIRANSDSVKEIPPVALPCFDTEKGEYNIVYSDSVPLDVAATSILTSADMQGRDASNVNRKVEATRKGINANYDDIDLFVEQSFSITAAITQPTMLTVVSIPFAAFVLSLFAKIVTYKRPGSVEAKIRRNAAKNAIACIKKLPKDSSERYKIAISVMQQYVGARFDRVANSITAGDCHDAILSATGSKDHADSFKEIFESCESACYTGGQVEFDAPKLTQLIRDIEKGASK